MNRIASLLLLSLVTLPVLAGIQPLPGAARAVADPANVVDDRGAKLEIYPTQRATPQISVTTHQVVHRVATARATDAMGPRQLGVVFNHAMQQQGYVSGEIAFKLKAGATTAGFAAAQYPGLKRIVASGVYVVNARSPAEFLSLIKRLQGNSAVQWVEPTVQY